MTRRALGAANVIPERSVIWWKRGWLPASETFIRNQADALPPGWNVVFLGTHRIQSQLARSSDVLIFEGRRFGKLRERLLSATGRSITVQRRVAGVGAAVMHAHFATEARVISRIAKAAGIPLVVSVHGQDLTAAPLTTGIRGFVFRRRLRKTLHEAACVIAVSGFMAELAVKYGAHPSRVRVHHIGIPIPPLRRVEDARPRWDVVFVGRLVSKKGVDHLLKAVADVDQSIRVVIVGDGPLKNELEDLAGRLNVDATFLGQLTPDEVAEVLASSRMFVGPSQRARNGDSEGFGMVFLEAAAQELPVVAYAHGGVVEAVASGETGILVPEGDVVALAEAIDRLYRDSDLAREMGKAGRRRVEHMFDVSRQSRLLAEIYDEVATRLPAAN